MENQIHFTDEQKNEVIKTITEYLQEYGNSECIAQGDSAQIRAIEIMCEIADIVNPIT
jgi:hypothetical protein